MRVAGKGVRNVDPNQVNEDFPTQARCTAEEVGKKPEGGRGGGWYDKGRLGKRSVARTRCRRSGLWRTRGIFTIQSRPDHQKTRFTFKVGRMEKHKEQWPSRNTRARRPCPSTAEPWGHPNSPPRNPPPLDEATQMIVGRETAVSVKIEVVHFADPRRLPRLQIAVMDWLQKKLRSGFTRRSSPQRSRCCRDDVAQHFQVLGKLFGCARESQPHKTILRGHRG